MSGPPVISASDWDLFSREVLTKYFAAREHEVYFHSLKNMVDRRDFYARLIEAVTEILAFWDDALSLELLNCVIFRRRKMIENVSPGLAILDYLRKTNPQGVELLALTLPVTFGSLRNAYRDAAKKYHPDVGGANEAMKLVNLAYAEFHDVLSQWKEAPATRKAMEATADPIIGYMRFEVRSAADYLISLGVLLVSIHTDSWAVDRANAQVQLLREHGLLSSGLGQQAEFNGYFSHLIGKLSERLRIAGFARSARSVRGVKDSTREKIIIMHCCQAENLYRLKVIDEKRYREAKARFEKRRSGDESVNLDLARFRERGGFALLPYDVPFRGTPRKSGLVPIPKYFFYRIDHLSDDQRAEYFCAFGPAGPCNDVRQYLYTRMSSYMCSLIHAFSAEEAGVIERECEFLRKLFPQCTVNLDAVLGASRHLRQLDSTTRKKKLSLLQKLDTTERPQPGVIAISLSGEGGGDTHVRITPSQEYSSVVMASVERLEMALRTGSIRTTEERVKENDEWSQDIQLIRQLNSNDITARARDTLWNHRDESQTVIEAVKAHIEQLLDAGSKIAPQNLGQLQLGYWIDGMSAALVRLKRWDEALHWLELFFGLDSRYQDRLAASEREKMLRRLTRCKAELTKQGKSLGSRSTSSD